MKITLSNAKDEYRNHLQAKGLAPRSVKNSIQLLNMAEKEWGDIYVHSIRAVHIDRLFAANPWAPTTRNLYLGGLRKFFAWARNHSYMPKDFDPTFGWRNQKIPNVTRLRLDKEEFYPLLETAVHPRDRIALALGLFLFVRASELTTIRVNDVDMKNSTVEIFRVKTNDYDTLPICDELREEIVTYLNWYRQDQGQLVGNWYLCPSKKPNKWVRDEATGYLVQSDEIASLRPETVIGHPYVIPQRALVALGYPSTRWEGFHTLRRSGAYNLFQSLRYEQGTDALMRVSSMLGHRDVKVTQHYIGLNQERDLRNTSLAGRPMFPGLKKSGTLRLVERSSNG